MGSAWQERGKRSREWPELSSAPVCTGNGNRMQLRSAPAPPPCPRPAASRISLGWAEGMGWARAAQSRSKLLEVLLGNGSKGTPSLRQPGSSARSCQAVRCHQGCSWASTSPCGRSWCREGQLQQAADPCCAAQLPARVKPSPAHSKGWCVPTAKATCQEAIPWWLLSLLSLSVLLAVPRDC